MARTYEILDQRDFRTFVDGLQNYANKQNEFPKVNITVKKWRKDKTPKQLRYYWVCISELRKAFLEAGYEFTKDQLDEIVKNENGFANRQILPNGRCVTYTKSISDGSEDVNAKVMCDLIDFIIRYAAINLDYIIEDPR